MLKHNAFTLLELIVSMASSFILVAGLAGSLYISNQALNGSANARQSLAASTVLRDLITDVSQANAFTERTARAITFTVPDRNGDLAPEVIRYAWSGVVGDPLTYQYNGSAAVDVATDVQSFNLSALTRELTASSVTAPVANGVVFEGLQPAYLGSDSNSLSIDIPAGTAEGDLLIACVATDGNSAASLSADGWNPIHIGGNHTTSYMIKVSLGVWWKLAAASEPSPQFTWSPSECAYGWIMRFTGHDPTSPIHASNSARGSATSAPPSPSVTTTVENAMIVRLGGFDDPDITVGNPGASVGNPITMNYSGTGLLVHCSGGGGYQIQSTAGDSGPSTFTLTASEEYVTVTIAIAPETSE